MLRRGQGYSHYRRASTTQSLMALDYIGPPAHDVLTGLYNRLTKICREQGFRYVLDSSQISLQKLLIIHCGYHFRGTPLESNMFIACPLQGSAPEALTDHLAWSYGYGDSELDIDLPI